MATYADGTLDRIPPKLLSGKREHVIVFQDKSIFHTNEYRRQSWLTRQQQPIRKKGNGRVVHVSDFISETIGQIKLYEAQITMELTKPAECRLPTFEAQKIIYPGKGFNAWWDLAQLVSQMEHTIKVFEHTHPDCVAIFVFDRSSAHKGFAENALNIHNMNINPGGKQRKLRDTTIPLSNPALAPGEEDTRSQVQKMCFPDDHTDPELRGKPKGIRLVLQERKSIWDKFTMTSSAKINFSYSILFHLTTSYSSYLGGKKGISRNKTSFFLLMMQGASYESGREMCIMCKVAISQRCRASCHPCRGIGARGCCLCK